MVYVALYWSRENVTEKAKNNVSEKVLNNCWKNEIGYKKSSIWSRNVRFIIAKDGENNGKDFMTNVSDSS